MKSKIVLLIGLSLIATSAFGEFKNPNENKLAFFTDSDKVKNVATQNSNGEIIAFLITVNKNEIAVSNEALKKHLRPIVKNYALMLNKDHSNNLKATEALSNKINQKPEETQLTNNLKDKGEQELNQLKSLDNKQFEIAFIDDMVKGHQEALNKIDQSINQTNNPELKQLLIATRARVNAHLQHAKSIQDQLKSAN